MTRRPLKQGKYVYFLRRKDGVGPIKIGCSMLPKRRLGEFFRWSPYELCLLASAPGTHELEHALHRMFAAYHLHMEWFAPSDRLLSIIERINAGTDVEAAMQAEVTLHIRALARAA